MLEPLPHWHKMRQMEPPQWELAWRLRRHPRWRWRSGMGMIYPDGRFMSYQGVVLPGGEPLPYLLNERTAGCLIGLLSETGEGWQRALAEALCGCSDWREGAALALLTRWSGGGATEDHGQPSNPAQRAW